MQSWLLRILKCSNSHVVLSLVPFTHGNRHVGCSSTIKPHELRTLHAPVPLHQVACHSEPYAELSEPLLLPPRRALGSSSTSSSPTSMSVCDISTSTCAVRKLVSMDDQNQHIKLLCFRKMQCFLRHNLEQLAIPIILFSSIHYGFIIFIRDRRTGGGFTEEAVIQLDRLSRRDFAVTDTAHFQDRPLSHKLKWDLPRSVDMLCRPSTAFLSPTSLGLCRRMPGRTVTTATWRDGMAHSCDRRPTRQADVFSL